MTIKNILVKVQDKVNVAAGKADHELELRSLWAEDNTRPWDTYSRESFCRFWDITQVEHRSK